MEFLPDVPFVEKWFTWTNGNLTKIVAKARGITNWTEINYEYDPARPAKNFLFFTYQEELEAFQPIINTGNQNKNLPIKATTIDFDETGLSNVRSVASFYDYEYYSNGYVKKFNTSGGSFSYIYRSDVTYALKYKCF
ncbi:MAG TPA: hypothetical protein VM012_08255 [Flavitalea sp.]|nr:hypothetical protein [Flavitalea sp.]